MTRNLKIAAPVATLALALAAFIPSASARPFGFHAYFGGPRVVVGPSVYVGPGYYAPGWYGTGAYGLGWYEPYGFVAAPSAGHVKFETKMKDAAVYIDGGYAGTIGQLKTFPLHAGDHNLELRTPDGRTMFQERINVVAGKTLKIPV